MIIANPPAEARLTASPPTRSEMGWLVAVAVAFLIVHIVAGTIWMRASANEGTPTAYNPLCLLCD